MAHLNSFDRFCIVWFVVINACSFAAFGFDKWRAGTKGRRIPEFTLALLGALGGWPSGLIAIKLFHHKTMKLSFKIKYGLALIPFGAEILAWWHWH